MRGSLYQERTVHRYNSVCFGIRYFVGGRVDFCDEREVSREKKETSGKKQKSS